MTTTLLRRTKPDAYGIVEAPVAWVAAEHRDGPHFIYARSFNAAGGVLAELGNIAVSPRPSCLIGIATDPVLGPNSFAWLESGTAVEGGFTVNVSQVKSWTPGLAANSYTPPSFGRASAPVYHGGFLYWVEQRDLATSPNLRLVRATGDLGVTVLNSHHFVPGVSAVWHGQYYALGDVFNLALFEDAAIFTCSYRHGASNSLQTFITARFPLDGSAVDVETAHRYAAASDSVEIDKTEMTYAQLWPAPAGGCVGVGAPPSENLINDVLGICGMADDPAGELAYIWPRSGDWLITGQPLPYVGAQRHHVYVTPDGVSAYLAGLTGIYSGPVVVGGPSDATGGDPAVRVALETGLGYSLPAVDAGNLVQLVAIPQLA